LAEPGETPTIDLHSTTDRPALCGDLARHDLGWEARYGMESSAHDLAAWWQAHSGGVA
jgi:UDP-glucose 4-epimerase